MRSLYAPRAWLLPLLLFILLAATSACGFVLAHNGPASFDAAILLWFRASDDTGRLAGPEWALTFWLALTWLGDTIPRIVVAVFTIFGLLLLRRWHNALFIAGVLISGIALSTTLKNWVARPRPQLVTHFDHFSSMSFPSGHALNSTLFYLTIALVLVPLLPQHQARCKILRWNLYAFAIVASLATGISRVALGVHWPSDVLAGWVIAAAWVGLWLVLAKHYWPKALL
jgi:undecaprenyl-diphosphatase